MVVVQKVFIYKKINLFGHDYLFSIFKVVSPSQRFSLFHPVEPILKTEFNHRENRTYKNSFHIKSSELNPIFYNFKYCISLSGIAMSKPIK